MSVATASLNGMVIPAVTVSFHARSQECAIVRPSSVWLADAECVKECDTHTTKRDPFHV